MSSFERIRDRLPSLYRPADDDASGEPLPLAVADILELNGAPVPGGSLSAAHNGVLVNLAAPTTIQSFRLAPTTVPGSLAALELYRMSGNTPLAVPAAVARVSRGNAVVLTHFREQRFLLRLKRPGLLSRMMWAMSQSLDDWDRDASHVMQSRWLDYADHAQFSPYMRRSRAIENLPPLRAGDEEIPLFPYVRDLARMGSLLSLLPWREPAAQRERVEAYRQRIRRVVAMYRDGLGTPEAMRRMIEVQLPVDLTAERGLQDRAFTLEEFAPVVRATAQAAGRGSPTDMVGPLMRWKVTNAGMETTAPTIYIQGVTPVGGVVDATVGPEVELFSQEPGQPRVAIAYDGTLAPGQTLRIRPTHSSWLGGADGLRRAETLPGGDVPADPTANGPWENVADAPEGVVLAAVQGPDQALWIAVEGDNDSSAVHRFAGGAWTQVGTLPTVQKIVVDGMSLLFVTIAGVRRSSLFPEGEVGFDPQPDPPGLSVAVHTVEPAKGGGWWVGTAAGLGRLDDALEPQPFVLGADEGTETSVYAIYQEDGGTVFVGCELGLFCYQPELDDWYWYRGEDRSEQSRDWSPFRPTATGAQRGFPSSDDVFLPPVTAVRRGPDASLWIGTDRGICRYIARSVGGPSYTTLLEAFPDLTAGRVHAIDVDARGRVWFGTDDGLFQYDGRDWWQVQSGELVRLALGSSSPLDPDTVRQWRFSRSLDRWEFVDSTAPAAGWTGFSGVPRGQPEGAVRAVVWTDSAVADLGSWDGTTFTPGDVEPAPLRSRIKPEETRVVEGGIPSIPRLPSGVSEWRYLALEPEEIPEPSRLPAWTMEGRLLPPPVDRAAVLEGRHGSVSVRLSIFDDAAFAFNPAAKVWMTWHPKHPLTVLARLRRNTPDEIINPVILDRVWEGMQQVRPAGVRTQLAVDEEVVRGG